ncbi:MAG: GH25 family lysozyme [Actinomycetota bacterium]
MTLDMSRSRRRLLVAVAAVVVAGAVAAAAGLERGAYHFFTLCTPGTEQARNFLRVVPEDPAALPPAIDLEFAGNCAARPEPASVAREVDAFMAAVEEATGERAVLYVEGAWEERYPVKERTGRLLWIAPAAASDGRLVDLAGRSPLRGGRRVHPRGSRRDAVRLTPFPSQRMV